MAAGHCAEGGRERSERAGTAVEYEYRCAEYEYEYDGGGNPLRCLAVIRTQSALRTVLVLVLAALSIPR